MCLGRFAAIVALVMFTVGAGSSGAFAATALDPAPAPPLVTGESCPETCETTPPACPIVCAFTYPDDIFPDQCSDAVAADLDALIPCLGFSVGPLASFDRTLGWIEVVAFQHPECFGVVSDLIAADRFWLVGPPAGEPVAFTARLVVKLGFGAGFASGALREGAGAVVFQSATSPIELALQHSPGEAFILRYGVRVFPDLGISATGQLTFEGLPAGYSVASCAGYGTTVAVTPATWSSVKHLYRH